MEKTKLSRNCTLGQYLGYKINQNKVEIIGLFLDRFSERYVNPFKGNRNKHGFSMMAISCLMIENFYCFQQGYDKTPSGKGNVIFNDFFKNSCNLTPFAEINFYRNIRCGLLHQGETYEGWKIRRKGSIVDLSRREINANLFMIEVSREIDTYAQKISEKEFGSKEWKNMIKKFDSICKNCERNDD